MASIAMDEAVVDAHGLANASGLRRMFAELGLGTAKPLRLLAHTVRLRDLPAERDVQIACYLLGNQAGDLRLEGSPQHPRPRVIVRSYLVAPGLRSITCAGMPGKPLGWAGPVPAPGGTPGTPDLLPIRGAPGGAGGRGRAGRPAGGLRDGKAGRAGTPGQAGAPGEARIETVRGAVGRLDTKQASVEELVRSSYWRWRSAWAIGWPTSSFSPCAPRRSTGAWTSARRRATTSRASRPTARRCWHATSGNWRASTFARSRARSRRCSTGRASTTRCSRSRGWTSCRPRTACRSTRTRRRCWKPPGRRPPASRPLPSRSTRTLRSGCTRRASRRRRSACGARFRPGGAGLTARLEHTRQCALVLRPGRAGRLGARKALFLAPHVVDLACQIEGEAIVGQVPPQEQAQSQPPRSAWGRPVAGRWRPWFPNGPDGWDRCELLSIEVVLAADALCAIGPAHAPSVRRIIEAAALHLVPPRLRPRLAVLPLSGR